MPDPIETRRALMSDGEIIATFNIALARETEGKALDPVTVQKGVSAILKDAHKGIYYVAETDDRVVGQLMLTYEWSDWRNGTFWWVQSVFVAEAYRGKGVFRQLMKRVSDEASNDAGCVGLRLYVHHQNLSAIETYRKLAFYELDYKILELGGKYSNS